MVNSTKQIEGEKVQTRGNGGDISLSECQEQCLVAREENKESLRDHFNSEMRCGFHKSILQHREK